MIQITELELIKAANEELGVQLREALRERDEARKLAEEMADEWDAACQVVISEWRAIAADKDAEIDEARRLAEEWREWALEHCRHYEHYVEVNGLDIQEKPSELPWEEK